MMVICYVNKMLIIRLIVIVLIFFLIFLNIEYNLGFRHEMCFFQPCPQHFGDEVGTSFFKWRLFTFLNILVKNSSINSFITEVLII